MSSKEEFQNKINVKTEEINKKLAELEAKANKAESKIKVEGYKQIEFLRKKLGQAQSQSDDLKSVKEGALKRLTMSIEKVWQELSDAVDEAASKMK